MFYRHLGAASLPVSARQFLQVAESKIGIGTWAWRQSDGAMVWSEAMHRLMRTDPGTHAPSLELILDRTHPDDRWIVREKLRAGADLDAEPIRCVFPDGTLRRHLCHKQRMESDKGTILLGLVQDVTETRNTHDLLIQRQRQFDMLVGIAGMILWRAEADGTPFLDHGWCNLTGTTLAQNAGTGWLDCLHPEDRPGTMDAWRRAVEAKSFYSTTYRVRTLDGSYCGLDVKASPLLNQHGDIIEWLGYAVRRREPSLASSNIQISAGSGSGGPGEDDHPRPHELKAARDLIGMSVEDLAAESGISASTISRYEASSDVRIRRSNLLRLRQVLAARNVSFSTASDGTMTLSYKVECNAKRGHLT